MFSAYKLALRLLFLVKNRKTKDKRKCKIYYIALDDFWRKAKETRMDYTKIRFRQIAFERIEPDEKNNWINQTDNDWESLLPLIDKEVKAGKSEKAIFKIFFTGCNTTR